jgi:hypothetical protein
LVFSRFIWTPANDQIQKFVTKFLLFTTCQTHFPIQVRSYSKNRNWPAFHFSLFRSFPIHSIRFSTIDVLARACDSVLLKFSVGQEGVNQIQNMITFLHSRKRTFSESQARPMCHRSMNASFGRCHTSWRPGFQGCDQGGLKQVVFCLCLFTFTPKLSPVSACWTVSRHWSA